MISRPVSLALLALSLCCWNFAAAQSQPLLHTVPFHGGDGKYLIYRIPAIWVTPQKTLLAFAEGRVAKRKAAGNIDLVLRRSLDLGQTWEPQQVVADLGEDFCGNPCVVQDPTSGRIWLAFTRSRGEDVEEQIASGAAPGTQVWITHSDDDGVTWAPPSDISASTRKPSWGWYGTGPGLGLYLGDKQGRLLIPAYHTEGGVYRTHCFYSDDHGASWKLGAVAADHTSEPQVVQLTDRSLLMNARTIAGHGEHRTLRISRDRGETWSTAEGLANLPENLCQGCIYRCFRTGSHEQSAAGAWDLIFTQPSARNRTGVFAWISEDEGKSWPRGQTLWNGPSAYTAMIRAQDGSVCLLLECGKTDVYQQIAFVRLSPEWLKARKAP